MDLGLRDAAADLRHRGSPDAVALTADTADDAQVQQIFANLGDRWGGELNILVNAVGPTVRGTFDDLTDDDWRRAVDEGVMGGPVVAFLVSRRNSYMTGADINVDGGSDFT